MARLDPWTFYPLDVLRRFGLDADALHQAHDAGELPATIIDGQPHFKGRDVIAWLSPALAARLHPARRK